MLRGCDILSMNASGDVLRLDHDDHPDANLFVASEKWCGVDPAMAAFDVTWVGLMTALSRAGRASSACVDSGWDPSYFGGDADAGGHCALDSFANMRLATDAIEEA